MPTDIEREYRFLPARPEAEALMESAARHARLVTYDRARPVAYARTTYLDTPDLVYYRTTAAGPVRRRLRIREYAAAADIDSPPVFTGICFLELKESAGRDREKHRVQVDPDELLEALQCGLTPALAARLARTPMLPELQARAPGELLPRLITWYRRVTLAEGARVRVTMDEGIAYGRPVAPSAAARADAARDRSGGSGHAGLAVPSLDLVEYGPSRVIEVKVIGSAPGWLEPALASLVEEHQYSKFRMGMRALQRRSSSVGRRTVPLDVPGLVPDNGGVD